MPFVKRTGIKKTQHAYDAHKIFFGRTSEIRFFKEHILVPEDPTYNIVSIDGQGGIGKSTLLTKFINDASAADFKDYCLTALVNDRQTTPVNIMERFADQLPLEGEYQKAQKQYKDILRKLQAQHEDARNSLARKATTDIIDSVTKDVPFVGGILKGGAEGATNYILEELHYRQLLKDAERMEDPIGDLTRAFIADLNRLAEVTVIDSVSRAKRQHRIILFFDTFEQLAQVTTPWLLDYFLEADVSSDVVLVIAGRDPLEQLTLNDPKRWLPYRENHTIYSISLDSFTKEETSNYLIERGIKDTERIDLIWQLSQGLPLYLGFLTADPQGKVDHTASVIANFLRWIPEQEQIKRRIALDASLFSRPFNQDELEAFTYIPEQERSIVYDWLTAQPFVQSNALDGRYSYHPVAQELFSRHLYQLSPNECHNSRSILIQYYERLLRDFEAKEGKDAYKFSQWLELTLALVYQLFLLPSEENCVKAIEQVLNAFEKTKQVGEIKRVLNNLSQKQPIYQIRTEVVGAVTEYIQYLEDDKNWQELLRTANYLLNKVAQESTFSAKILALLYIYRGYSYKQLNRLEEAPAECNRAIDLDPEYANLYFERGNVYLALNRYEEALADYKRVIELNPEAVGAYQRRSDAYVELKKYEEALADCNRAIELNPKAVTSYHRRSEIYYTLKKYEEALADCNSALELNPEAGNIYYLRGVINENLGWYEEALADFSQTIELNSGAIGAYQRRGYLYHTHKRYEEALADWNRAIELIPKSAGSYFQRGTVYRALERYDEVLSDWSRAIELDPDVVEYYFHRGWVYLALERCEEALADYSRAIELAPENANLYDRRADTYYALKQYEQALADSNRAIDLNPDAAEYYFHRGWVYQALKRYEEALADCNRAIDLAPENANLYFERASVYQTLKRYEEALADCNRAIELNPKDASFYNLRGVRGYPPLA